jgi:type II secretory pathway pseudopilin PulG
LDVLLAATLIALASTLLAHSLAGAPQREQERELRLRLDSLRRAVQQYQSDHGFYPGSAADYGYPLSDEQFRRKLTQYTDLRGVASQTRSHRFRFGPYLSEVPVEPFGRSTHLDWALQEHRSPEELSRAVAEGGGVGGWYYAPETGSVLANLGKSFPEQLASF